MNLKKEKSSFKNHNLSPDWSGILFLAKEKDTVESWRKLLKIITIVHGNFGLDSLALQTFS